MAKITEEARGRTCQIRLFGCKWDDGVVACHYALTDHHGIAQKAPDFMIAFGCAHCHDIVDGRKKSTYETPNQVEVQFLRGVMRTQAILAREGKLVDLAGGRQ